MTTRKYVEDTLLRHAINAPLGDLNIGNPEYDRLLSEAVRVHEAMDAARADMVVAALEMFNED